MVVFRIMSLAYVYAASASTFLSGPRSSSSASGDQRPVKFVNLNGEEPKMTVLMHVDVIFAGDLVSKLHKVAPGWKFVVPGTEQ